jgi:ABC-type Na+ transport system ATPase subunit NatA
VLFSTHLMDQVARLCSHVVVINRGTLVAKGGIDELRAAHGEKSLEDVFRELTQAPAES